MLLSQACEVGVIGVIGVGTFEGKGSGVKRKVLE